MKAAGKLLLTPQAKEDLLFLWQYLSEHNMRAGDRLLRRLARSSQLVADHPGVALARPEYGALIRQWRFGKYFIVNRELEDGVEVVRYLDVRRDKATGFVQ